MQVRIILIDNLLDKGFWGEYHAIGEAAAANLASRFNLLTGRKALPDHQLRIVNFFNHLDNVLPYPAAPFTAFFMLIVST
jgi:hypothetical protein